MEDFRKAPLGGVYSSTPPDGFKVDAIRRFCDERCFTPSAMIAPEIVIVEGLEALADRDNARSCRVYSNRVDFFAGHASRSDGLPRGLGERTHMVTVALGGMVGIVLPSMQGVIAYPNSEHSSLAVNN
jgi:hypothetical protein